MTRPPAYLGVDLGKSIDYTAIVLAEPSLDPKPVYTLGHIERIPLQTRYTTIAKHVGALVMELRKPEPSTEIDPLTRLPIPGERAKVSVGLDYTGVGAAVAEMFIDEKMDCGLSPITITGGLKVTWDQFSISIPKAHLVAVVQRVLQEERLKIPTSDPACDLLTQELTDFQAVISPSGHVSYGAAEDWRSGKHDDLVLAAALALWLGENRRVVSIS